MYAGVDVGTGVSVGAGVDVGVGSGVDVGTGVSVGSGVAVGVGDCVGVAVGNGVGDGVVVGGIAAAADARVGDGEPAPVVDVAADVGLGVAVLPTVGSEMGWLLTGASSLHASSPSNTAMLASINTNCFIILSGPFC